MARLVRARQSAITASPSSTVPASSRSRASRLTGLSHNRRSWRTNGPLLRRAEELARDQAVLLVHPRVDLGVELDVALDEAVAVHVLPDQARRVGDAVREPARGREQQQVRAPGVARRDDERLRPVGHHVVRPIAVQAGGALDARRASAAVGNDQLPHQRAIVQRDRLTLEQLLEGEVRPVAGLGRAHRAGVAALALAAAVVGTRVLGLRRAPERDAALLAPGLELLQVPGQGHPGHRVRLGPRVLGQRTGIARHPKTPFGLAVVALELGPADRPVDGQTEHRLQPGVLLGEAIGDAAPVHRLPAEHHRPRDGAGGRLVGDVVARPRVLAVGHHPVALRPALLRRRRRCRRPRRRSSRCRDGVRRPSVPAAPPRCRRR